METGSLLTCLVNRSQPQQNTEKRYDFRTPFVRIGCAEFILLEPIIAHFEKAVKSLPPIRLKLKCSNIFSHRRGYCSASLGRSQRGKIFRLKLEKPYYQIPSPYSKCQAIRLGIFLCAKNFGPFSLTSPTPYFHVKSHRVKPHYCCPAEGQK